MERDEYGNTTLHNLIPEACKDKGWGYNDFYHRLFSHPEEVNAKNNSGLTPLHMAAAKGHIGVVRALLDVGADINATCNGNWTPLHKAAKNNHRVLFNLLLEKGADHTIRTRKRGFQAARLFPKIKVTKDNFGELVKAGAEEAKILENRATSENFQESLIESAKQASQMAQIGLKVDKEGIGKYRQKTTAEAFSELVREQHKDYTEKQLLTKDDLCDVEDGDDEFENDPGWKQEFPGEWAESVVDQPNRSKYGSARYNADKPAMSHLDPHFLMDLAALMSESAKKYERYNYALGQEYHTPYDSGMRHLLKLWMGEDLDEDSGYHHALHLAANAMILYNSYRKKDPDLDTRCKHW